MTSEKRPFHTLIIGCAVLAWKYDDKKETHTHRLLCIESFSEYTLNIENYLFNATRALDFRKKEIGLNSVNVSDTVTPQDEARLLDTFFPLNTTKRLSFYVLLIIPNCSVYVGIRREYRDLTPDQFSIYDGQFLR